MKSIDHITTNKINNSQKKGCILHVNKKSNMQNMSYRDQIN